MIPSTTITTRSRFQAHPYHLVSPSPWPLYTSISLLTLTTSVVSTMHGFYIGHYFLILGLISVIYSMSLWFRDIISEGTYLGNHTLSDGAFGSCFYFGTGFHGLHVIIGTAFLAVGTWRVLAYHSTDNHHLGLESAILYWHFVDVVWLFLFISIYYWGS